ncbi:hypothetical protein BDR04DRAFT_1089518 [Suillus decipiens]|nr:hypothetical protein BDR04DRAFT_1089518 [Suillus decipiens]
MTTASDTGGEPSEGAPRNTNTKNYIVGLGLLFVVVLLWTGGTSPGKRQGTLSESDGR